MSTKLCVPSRAPDHRSDGAVSFPSQACTEGISPIGPNAADSSFSAMGSVPRHAVPGVAYRTADPVPRALPTRLEARPALAQLSLDLVPPAAAVLTGRVVAVAVCGAVDLEALVIRRVRPLRIVRPPEVLVFRPVAARGDVAAGPGV